MTNKEYRKHVGVSKSDLQEMTKSPLHFKSRLETEQTDTMSLLFGRAAHKYILEKDDFFNEFAIIPAVDRRTKAGREAYSQFLEENEEKDVINEEQYNTILAMAEQIDRMPLARELLTGECEQSFFWTDETTGEPCKCRPDCLKRDKHLIVDYKTTDSCQDGHFERSVKKYGYKLQAGMYTEGLFQNTLDQYGFVFVAQEKTAPYAVRIYKCNEEFIRQGYDKFRELIGLLHKCKETDTWPGYEWNGMEVVELLPDDIE